MNSSDKNFSNSQHQLRSVFGRSVYIVQQLISLTKLTQECKKHSVQIVQSADKRLQSGLNFISLRTRTPNQKQSIVLFVTRFKQNQITVTAYFEGIKLQKAHLSNEQELAKLIKRLSDCKKTQKNNQQANNSMKIIQKLNTRIWQLAKSQKSQMVAIQKLKTTSQYKVLIVHQIQLSTQVQSLSQSLIHAQARIQAQNNKLLPKVSEIEALKDQIQILQYKYQQVCKPLRNVKQLLAVFLEGQRGKIDKMEISNQNQLNQFIVQAKKLKKLELQKRFIH